MRRFLHPVREWLSDHPRQALAGILLAGLLVRLLVFDTVAVWGDVGFYPYNAHQIAEGQQPFIDFIGRSPLFLYLITPLFELAPNNIVWGRAFIITVWLGVAGLVYAYATAAHSPRAGLWAAAFFWLVPYQWAFGMWFNTQGVAALFVLAALLLYARHAWGYRHGVWFTVIGGLLAAAYLTRRSAIVAGIAIALFVCWEAHRDGHDLLDVGVAYGSLAIGALPVLFATYALVAQGDLDVTLQLFNTHVIALFETSGRGGFALAGADPQSTRTLAGGRIPLFNDLCQLCGPLTVVRLLQMTIVALPTVAALTIYARSATEEILEDSLSPYLVATVAGLYVYALGSLAWAGFWLRFATFVLLGVAVVLAWRAPAPRASRLWTRPVQLGVLFAGGLTYAYLYRNRLIHVYYFLDVYPMLAVLAGAALTDVLEETARDAPTDDPLVTARESVAVTPLADGGRRRQYATRVVGGLLAAMVAVSILGAYPLMDVATGNAEGWQTVDSIEAYGDDLEARTWPDEQVFTSLPAYTANADREVALDMPRIHYLAGGYPDTRAGERTERKLAHALTTGEILVAVMDQHAWHILDAWPAANASFQAHYCPAPASDQPLYNRTDAVLYEYHADAEADCGG